MKHTYIFIVADGLTEHDLRLLAQVVGMRTVSYKVSHSNFYYDRVQVFTNPGEMHLIANRAGFSGEQLRVALPAARRRGDLAVARASKGLDKLRKASEVSHISDAQFLKNLRRMVKVSAPLQMPGGTKRSKRSA